MICQISFGEINRPGKHWPIDVQFKQREKKQSQKFAYTSELVKTCPKPDQQNFFVLDVYSILVHS